LLHLFRKRLGTCLVITSVLGKVFIEVEGTEIGPSTFKIGVYLFVRCEIQAITNLCVSTDQLFRGRYRALALRKDPDLPRDILEVVLDLLRLHFTYSGELAEDLILYRASGNPVAGDTGDEHHDYRGQQGDEQDLEADSQFHLVTTTARDC